MRSFSGYLRTLLVVVVVFATASCGFHPRGSYNLPPEIDKISVTSFDQYGTITRDVETQLRYHNLQLTSPQAGVANLHLRSENFREETLSLYQNARIAQQQFTYTLYYTVTIPNTGSYDFSTSTSRTYLDNPLTALAKSVEEEMLSKEMRVDAAKQIMRQLARLNTHIEDFEANLTSDETPENTDIGSNH